MFNFNSFKKIHFVGIGGISMSAIAKLMLNLKKEVSGSDDTLSQITNELEELGIDIKEHHSPQKVSECDLVVYTTAVDKTNKDLVLAKKLNKPILERAEFLGFVCKFFSKTLAVCGTHGKTTVSAMLALILESKNPTIHIGGNFSQIGGNLKLGGKDLFLTEACEFNKSFLHINPSISVITNIECDHMDCYKDKQEIEQTFIKFARQTSDFIVLNHNFLHLFDPYFAKSKITTFDIDKKSDFWATNLDAENGVFSFDVFNDNFYMGEIQLNVAGKHNVLNALASIAVATKLGISFVQIQKKLKDFKGVNRRFQTLYDKDFKVIHDYAHHPTEIACAIQTAQFLKPKNLVCVFQPHTYSRTKSLFQEFLKCFNGVDKLFLLPTYSAREKEIEGGSAFDLFKSLPEDLNATYFKDELSCQKKLLKNTQKGDLILWLGAGTIEIFAKNFVKKL